MGIASKLCVALAGLSAVARAGEFFVTEDQTDLIQNSFMVVMDEGVTDEEFDTHKNFFNNLVATAGGESTPSIETEYNFGTFRGYHGLFNEETARNLANQSHVKLVSQERIFRIQTIKTQKNAPDWGLGRISHKVRGSADYVFDDSAGQGINIYGVDTGIDITHPDFGGRATFLADFTGEGEVDNNGHGTHTAGTFASNTFGVAKNAKIFAIKVLSGAGSGTTSAIIQGIQAAVQHAQQQGKSGKAVINMSLGGGLDPSMNSAATSASRSGMLVAVAAGNSAEDAQGTSPASAPGACTAAAIGMDDQEANFSNFGHVVAINAPGVNVESTWPGGITMVDSGTSMASPHVAGVGAYLMALENITSDQACNRIKQLGIASAGVRPGTTNKILYNNSGQ